jgi:hypothetical protein
MADKITFRGAHIMNFDVRQSPKGESTFVRIHMRADFSEPVMEAMEWEPRSKGHGGGDLIGELYGVKMMLKPSSRELIKYGFEMPIRQVKDFKLVVRQGKGAEAEEEEELTFVVETSSKRAYVTLGNWIENIGKEKGLLTVSYTDSPDDAQMKIGDVTATDEQRQAALSMKPQ